MKKVITAETCRTCGVCCVSLHDQESFADVDDTDLERLDPRWVWKNVIRGPVSVRVNGRSPDYAWIRSLVYGDGLEPAIRTEWRRQACGPFRGVEVCACVALRGSILSRVSCTIYGRRPKVCRTAVKPGDRTCREARRMYLEATAETGSKRKSA